MKTIIVFLVAFITNAGFAQTALVPGKNSFEKKWIRTGSYLMQWYALKDTQKIEIGEVLTQVTADKKFVSIVTEVKMKHSKTPWFDTTIAKAETLQPVSHSSYNAQRDMVLHFGKIVTGFYHDKIKQQHYSISDTAATAYFDSNLYPALIAWLPLVEGYSQVISIYDYNPAGKMGVINAFIKNVTSGTYQTAGLGMRDVWIVTVADEISNSQDNSMVYYIDKTDRILWKQEINVPGRKMVMIRKEP